MVTFENRTKSPVFEWSQKPTFEMSGFRMNPVFEWSVFGSLLYYIVRKQKIWEENKPMEITEIIEHHELSIESWVRLNSQR